MVNRTERNKQVAEEARKLRSLINFREEPLLETVQDELWKKIKKTIGKEDAMYSRKDGTMPSAPRSNRERWLRYAAALAGFLLVSAAALYLYYSLPVRHYTEYGEVKTIVLPDNSVVKLNANSSLRYTRNWLSYKPRRVWLNGEAFFTVEHTSNEQAFLVYTDDVVVRVTGTRFNVNSRHIDTKVVLNSGSVELHLNAAAGEKGAEEGAADLVMKPGELISWSAQTTKLNTRKVDPEYYSSWTDNILLFKETPIAEVCRSLEDHFGFDIELEGDSILNETFTGSIPMDNVDIFFETLSASLNIRIIKHDNFIYIEKN